MAEWKKVIVSGSHAELNSVTASGGFQAPNISSAGSNLDVVVVDSGGNLQKRTAAQIASAQAQSTAFTTMSFQGAGKKNVGTYNGTQVTASLNDQLTFVEGDNISMGFSSSLGIEGTNKQDFFRISAATTSIAGGTGITATYGANQTVTVALDQSVGTSDDVQFADIQAVHITASGNITASGIIQGSNLSGTNTGDVTLNTSTYDYLSINASQQITLGQIDISDDTNLVAGTNITLSGDTLNVDDAFLVNNANDTTTGTITAAGFNTTGASTGTAISASGGISASNVHTDALHVIGDVQIESGNVFGAEGFAIEVDVITVRSGSTQFGSGSFANDIPLTTHEFTGSLLVTGSGVTVAAGGTFTGDGAGLTNLTLSEVSMANLTDGNGIADFTYNGSGAANVTVELDGSTLAVGASGLKVNTAGIDTNELATNAVTTVKITDNNVTNAKLADMTRGTVKVGGSSNAPTDLNAKTSGYILVGDGTDIVSVAVSGDIGLASNGAVTIASDAVEGSMLNDNVISGQTGVNGAIADGDEFLFSDNGTLASVSASQISDYVSSSLGDVFTATDTTYNLSVQAGTGATSIISLTSSADTYNVTLTGTSNEISISENTGTNTITLSLPDDVTIGNDLIVTTDLDVNGAADIAGNLVVGGNLTVNGTSTIINTTELVVEDQFILLSSGSRGGGDVDGGILVQEGGSTAYVLGVKASDDRWALQKDLAIDNDGTVTSFSANDYLVTTKNATGAPSGNPTYGDTDATRAGQLYVDTATNDIYIYA